VAIVHTKWPHPGMMIYKSTPPDDKHKVCKALNKKERALTWWHQFSAWALMRLVPDLRIKRLFTRSWKSLDLRNLSGCSKGLSFSNKYVSEMSTLHRKLWCLLKSHSWTLGSSLWKLTHFSTAVPIFIDQTWAEKLKLPFTKLWHVCHFYL